MKRYGNLYPKIVEFTNIFYAAKQAQRGKRFRENVLSFNDNLENELIQLQQELRQKTYQPGEYRTFYIREPKRRMISAAPYRDRVVHHALCNVIVPIFERSFIDDSYANRLGFGSHRALRRFTEFARSSRYVLECDIKRYFPTIDHEILKTLIRRKIKCPETLWLIEMIIDNSNLQEPVIDYFSHDDLLTPVQRRKGLPIGNLTSQFLANVYLNGFDHFVKEQLKVTKYLRYVDDFALFSNEPEFLSDARVAIEEYLEQLRLKIHPIKSQLFETKYGANYVGFRVFPQYIRVRSHSLRRARYRLKKLRQDYGRGIIGVKQVTQSIHSWVGHLKHADTYQLKKRIFSTLVFTRD